MTAPVDQRIEAAAKAMACESANMGRAWDEKLTPDQIDHTAKFFRDYWVPLAQAAIKEMEGQ